MYGRVGLRATDPRMLLRTSTVVEPPSQEQLIKQSKAQMQNS